MKDTNDVKSVNNFSNTENLTRTLQQISSESILEPTE